MCGRKKEYRGEDEAKGRLELTCADDQVYCSNALCTARKAEAEAQLELPRATGHGPRLYHVAKPFKRSAPVPRIARVFPSTCESTAGIGAASLKMPQILDDKSEHCVPFIVERVQQWRQSHIDNSGTPAPPFIIGLNGVQGAGKTTLVGVVFLCFALWEAYVLDDGTPALVETITIRIR